MKPYRAIPEFYDPEYQDHDWLRDDVPFLLRQIGARPRRVLELCCGSGRAALPLAQAGHRVVGVDYDARMLRRAREKRDLCGLPESRLRLLEQDVLRLRVPGRFDWICILFNTLLNFPGLEQLDALLAGVRRRLAPGGRFWIDIFNPDLGRLAPAGPRRVDATLFHVPALGTSVLRETRIVSRPLTQVQEVTFTYSWHDRHGRPRRRRIRFDVTWMFPRELTLLLERHGMEVERAWGDHHGGALAEQSQRIIVAARRRVRSRRL